MGYLIHSDELLNLLPHTDNIGFRSGYRGSHGTAMACPQLTELPSSKASISLCQPMASLKNRLFPLRFSQKPPKQS